MLSNLIDTISKTTTPSSQDIALCRAYFEPILIARNTVLEEQGKVPQYLYFVSSGFMRLFYFDANGDEQTTHFCAPNGFIASFLSFIHQVNATENVECITDCELLRITNANLKKLIDESEDFKQFSLLIFQHAMAAATHRANDLATLSGEQHYKKLVSHHPQLVQNVPLQYLASYLGIKPESLSRIRRQVIS